MSEQAVSPVPQASPEGEEPPSCTVPWWRQVYNEIRTRMQGSSEMAALRDAVEELIEEASEQDKPTSEKILLTNILSFKEKHVVDCMVPRADIEAIDADSGIKALAELMIECRHSRIPVYTDTLDETVGMIHLKDVMRCLYEGQAPELKELLRPVLFVAPSMPVSKLLLQMRQTRHHMAMVIDEFGGVDGLVTIEDLVEEVVGDIDDEHDDPAVPEVVVRPDGTLLVDAGISLESFEERFGFVLSETERDSIDTLGGYVFYLAGHVPQIGEKVKGSTGLVFEVIERDQNRIKRLRVRGARKPAEMTATKPMPPA